MNLASSRSLFFLAFAGCVLLIGVALYMEHVMGLLPCPLCIVQRICITGFGLVCLVAAIHSPERAGRVAYSVIALLFAAFGAATAIRQIWLQSVPADQLPSCLPPLDYMMEAFPFLEIVRQVLHGTAECSEVSWTMLGMSIPEWTLLAFIGMLVFCVWQMLRRN